MTSSLAAYATAVPLNAIAAFGFGPIRTASKRPASALSALRTSHSGIRTTMESAGAVGRSILGMLRAVGGAATAEQFAFQTRDADPADIAEAIDRLETAGAVRRGADGSVQLTELVMQVTSSAVPSLADAYAINSDVLAKICSRLGVKVPSTKPARIAAITSAFADPATAVKIRDGLSPAALDLLGRIARIGGPTPVDLHEVDLPDRVSYTSMSSYSRLEQADRDPMVNAFNELRRSGIVGVADWGARIWIWREAWPLVATPFYTTWPSVPVPDIAPVATTPARVPTFAAAFDQALSAWSVEPPPVLKNGQDRVGKTQVRATARLLGLDVDVADLAGRLAIGCGLLFPDVVSASGRGRKRRVDEVWASNTPLCDAWGHLGLHARWAKLVAEWTDPNADVDAFSLANRHLVLWELSRLDPGTGYADAEAFGAWIRHRHGAVGSSDLVAEALLDLRLLGLVEATGPVALTTIGSMVLTDPAALDELGSDDAVSAFVQADLTVVSPPNLRHDLATRLAALADTESDSGAVVSRLSVARITRAVQAGDTAESIIEFLTELSSVPVGDTVTRLVHDAAALAGRVRVIAAPTVVVVGDPVDLVTALSVKAAKLVRISDTVAVSDLAHAKVRAALDRKGLAPELIIGAAAQGSPPKTSIDVDDDRSVERSAEFTGWLAVKGPLALTPALLERLDGPAKKPRSAAKRTSAKRGADAT